MDIDVDEKARSHLQRPPYESTDNAMEMSPEAELQETDTASSELKSAIKKVRIKPYLSAHRILFIVLTNNGFFDQAEQMGLRCPNGS